MVKRTLHIRIFLQRQHVSDVSLAGIFLMCGDSSISLQRMFFLRSIGANFARAVLAGASFKDTRNVPPDLAKRLDMQGVCLDERKNLPWFFWKANQAKPVESILDPQQAAPIRVFLSKSGVLNVRQRQLVDSVCGMLSTGRHEKLSKLA
jgi:hypothetical protein